MRRRRRFIRRPSAPRAAGCCSSPVKGHGTWTRTSKPIRQTFEQIQTLVTAAGGTLANVTMLRAYFLNMARDLETFRKVRQEFLVAPYPASTAVGVTELAVPGLEFEIEAVAVL